MQPARWHGVCIGVRISIERSMVWHLVSRTPSWFSCLLVLAVESWGASRSIAGVMSVAAGMAPTAQGGMAPRMRMGAITDGLITITIMMMMTKTGFTPRVHV